jgi:nitrate reductase gamma subunit
MIGIPLVIIAYALLLLSAVIFIYKAKNMAGLPPHLRWELAPVPHEKGKSHYGGSYLEEFEWWTKPREKSLINEAVYMFKEIFFLKGVLEHNKKLWYFSFPFHFGLYLLGAMVAFIFVNTVLGLLGLSQYENIFTSLISLFALIGYGIGTIGTLGLLASRTANPNLRNFNTGGTIFNLIVLLVFFITGLYAFMTNAGFSVDMTRFTSGLLTADMSLILPASITLHCIMGLLFLAYLPFTRMIHFVAKYFTYHDVRWNDAPMPGDKRLEKQVQDLLGQKVTWAAPHVKADGKKNWVDIVTTEDKHEE